MRHRDYVELSASPDRATFENRLIAAGHALDFGIVTAGLAVEHIGSKPTFMAIGNAPQASIDASKSIENVHRDPVIRLMKSLSVPFVWDQNTYVNAGAANIWESLAPFGFRNGVAVAMHISPGVHFTLGVDRPDPLPADEAKLTRLLADLHLLAAFAQGCAVAVMQPQGKSPAPVPKLTPREIEVLHWTAEGKTAWEVGQILALSVDTVNFHFRNVTRKLGVKGKHMAHARAVALGLL
jgi:DNA-binding CsgD family transcriptional regulator